MQLLPPADQPVMHVELAPNKLKDGVIAVLVPHGHVQGRGGVDAPADGEVGRDDLELLLLQLGHGLVDRLEFVQRVLHPVPDHERGLGLLRLFGKGDG